MPSEITKVQKIKFYIQDKEYSVPADDVSPSTSLNSYIRDTLQLKGTKGLCYQGGCGSCIVVLYSRDPVTDKDIYLAVNSCLIPLLSCNGWRIYTIEGIGDPLNGYHIVQQTLAQFNGTQCGYCSPGMVMNMYALYESGQLTMQEVENSFGGNICRCTGYRPILSAFKSLCTDVTSELLGTYPDIEDLKVCKKDKCEKKCAGKCDKESKVPFYHQLADASRWMKVYALSDLLTILSQAGDATYKLVCGNTARGVYGSYGGSVDIYIDVTSVPELKVNQIVGSTFVLGANNTLTNTMEIFTSVSGANAQFSYLQKLADHIDLVANVPVRNTGTLAGNLIMKHDNPDFPSDIFVILDTVGAKIGVTGTDGQEVQYSPVDFLNQNLRLKVITTITFPSYNADNVKYVSYKIMPRAQNSHAVVNAGFLFQLNANGTVTSATIVYGNINPTFTHATATENLLVGKNLFDNATLQQAFASLSRELICDVIPPDMSPDYRKQLAISLFYKAVLNIAPAASVTPRNQSGGTLLERPISSGAQDYQTNESLYPLTEAIPKIEALAQTSGQAQYIRDMPDVPHQLFATLILANAPPNSTLRNIDPSRALEVEGIEAFFSASDIPGENSFTPAGMFRATEPVFCTGRVLYYQQPVGVLVGTSQDVLRSATSLVQVTFDPPAVAPLLTSRQVLAAGRSDRVQQVQSIQPTRRGTDITQVVRGSFDIYHQAHFHMETQCCSVIPNENGLDIYPSSQWMDHIQLAVANLLQIRENKISVSVRRLGGAFGAKINRNGLISCATALAAWKLRRPVKMFMSLGDNMGVIGKRFPLSVDYEVGLNNQGVIQYLTATHYSDVGAIINDVPSYGISSNFMNSYVNDTFQLSMNAVSTDTHNNTWTRAPGTTEGIASVETIMEHCAVSLGMDGVDFRIANFATDSPLPRYVDDLKTWADIDQRKQDIEAFNAANRWKKRGMAIVPMSYGLDLSGPFSVVISIFSGDGTVQISHGGIEMGQGINTKAAQVCAYSLGIDLDMVNVIPSNNFNAPNNATSGGSVTSEAICYGVIQACNQLNDRIQPYKDRYPTSTWPDWVRYANQAGVNLSSIGMFTPSDPNVHSYLIYGIGATEVEVDILTGQHVIRRVDIIEDTGQSMSPMIDIGQVEGAFIMGMGYQTTENIIYNYEGRILTNNTWTYYPPGPKDIPIDFRVRFPRDNPNPVGVLNSKATAEPSLCLTISVPLAIRHAVASARLDAAPTNATWFPINGPTTVEVTYVNSLNDYAQYVL